MCFSFSLVLFIHESIPTVFSPKPTYLVIPIRILNPTLTVKHFPNLIRIVIVWFLFSLRLKRCIAAFDQDFGVLYSEKSSPKLRESSRDSLRGDLEVFWNPKVNLLAFFAAVHTIITRPLLSVLIYWKIGLIARSKLDLLTAANHGRYNQRGAHIFILLTNN